MFFNGVWSWIVVFRLVAVVLSDSWSLVRCSLLSLFLDRFIVVLVFCFLSFFLFWWFSLWCGFLLLGFILMISWVLFVMLWFVSWMSSWFLCPCNFKEMEVLQERTFLGCRVIPNWGIYNILRLMELLAL